MSGGGFANCDKAFGDPRRIVIDVVSGLSCARGHFPCASGHISISSASGACAPAFACLKSWRSAANPENSAAWDFRRPFGVGPRRLSWHLNIFVPFDPGANSPVKPFR
jgi:hypothetical protein